MKKAILCVDDEAIIAMSMRNTLHKYFEERAEVHTAFSAEKALELIDELYVKGTRLVVVISDYLMPGMRGDEFLIKLSNEHPDVEAIMVTGKANENTINDLKSKREMKAVFYKPWVDNDLINAVEECMN